MNFCPAKKKNAGVAGYVKLSANVYDGSDVAELMDIFTKDDSYNENKFPKTSKIKKRYKQTEGGVLEMCEIMERIEKDGRKEG